MDIADLRRAAIFEGLPATAMERLFALAHPLRCRAGDSLFRLGEEATRLHVALSGRVELTFPLSLGAVTREMPFEVKTGGSLVGWSALVAPYRFTLSARATEDSELAAFPRDEMLRLFEAEPQIGHVVMRHIAEVIGRRLLQMQALWARELQRAVTDSLTAAKASRP
jgi:CRP/FNR family cyclic AMP-dependent transcriptional regulator